MVTNDMRSSSFCLSLVQFFSGSRTCRTSGMLTEGGEGVAVWPESNSFLVAHLDMLHGGCGTGTFLRITEIQCENI
jgi:hypothetical protein